MSEIFLDLVMPYVSIMRINLDSETKNSTQLLKKYAVFPRNGGFVMNVKGFSAYFSTHFLFWKELQLIN